MSETPMQIQGDRDMLVNLDGFRKRSGLVVPFRRRKIEVAVQHAVDAVTRGTDFRAGPDIAARITERVIDNLNTPSSEYYVHPNAEGRRIPLIEDVQDLVEILLAEAGETMVVASYKRYRKRRQLARNRIRVRDPRKGDVDVTDASLLLVESTSENMTLPWDRTRIIKQVMDKTDLSAEIAISVAKGVENRIIASEIATINTTLIREMVNNELSERGFSSQLQDLSMYGIPRDYVEKLMFTKSTENSNIVNNNACIWFLISP